MTETARLALPLIQPSQAQKHVTVNEALVRLDGLVQLRLTSATLTTPPATVVDGAVFAVPSAATDAWSGRDGDIAIGTNGGWVFVTPQDGWCGWLIDERREVQCSDGAWVSPALGSAPSGAAVRIQTKEEEYVVQAGAAQDTSLAVPGGAMVLAASARVLDEITGTLTSWRLGTSGAADRFGSGLGLSAGSYAEGILGSPLTYYSASALRMDPVGGTFAGGRVRLAVHYLSFDLPAI